MMTEKLQTPLKKWYLENKRSLPWRQTQDPYLIWISEVMLQQTTVQAVIPYFLRFKEIFPNVNRLAQAPLEDVLSCWAGLGYYSRARNLHKAAKAIAQKGSFPRSFRELLELPGFGDYTSRAVASIAFGESVGVIDGNVIRILTRVYGLKIPWWKSKKRLQLQNLADQLCAKGDSAIINQAMMELGATICTPTSPACSLYPWLKNCIANKNNLVSKLPLKKEKKPYEFIELEMNLVTYKNKIALQVASDLPFLKEALFPPLKVKSLKEKPKKYHFQHSITHYKIYVKVQSKSLKKLDPRFQWYHKDELAKVNPSSLLKKALLSHSADLSTSRGL